MRGILPVDLHNNPSGHVTPNQIDVIVEGNCKKQNVKAIIIDSFIQCYYPIQIDPYPY